MTPHSPIAGRGLSWLPPVPLIGAKLLELRKRRTLMIVIVAFTVGLPVTFSASGCCTTWAIPRATRRLAPRTRSRPPAP